MPIKDPTKRKAYFRNHYHELAQKIRDYMDLDHVSGTKYKDVSSMTTYSWERVLAEIQKCDLVCSNCHRARTYLRSVGETVNAVSLNLIVQ